MGRTLKRTHCKRIMVHTGKPVTHNYLELKAVFLALKEFQEFCTHRTVLIATDNTTVVSYINKEGGMRSGPLCALLWRTLTWCSKQQVTQSPTHSRSVECGGGQAIMTGPDHSNRMVPPTRSLSGNLRQLALASNRPICYKIQQETSSICVSSTGSPSSSGGCTQPPLGGARRICLPTDSHLEQSGGETAGYSRYKNHLDRPGVAQHALVLGSGGHVQPGSIEPAQPAQLVDTTIQSDPPQESDKPESPCLAPRASAIKEQGFSEAVAARIEASQRGSTRSVYEAKWTIFTKWCISNKVDFRPPPVKSVADFLMYLFQDRKLQPSTIDGYRSAIADKLGNSSINIRKDENLTRLLDSFHRDRPKGRRGIPSWNLSLVLHQRLLLNPLRKLL